MFEKNIPIFFLGGTWVWEGGIRDFWPMCRGIPPVSPQWETLGNISKVFVSSILIKSWSSQHLELGQSILASFLMCALVSAPRLRVGQFWKLCLTFFEGGTSFEGIFPNWFCFVFKIYCLTGQNLTNRILNWTQAWLFTKVIPALVQKYEHLEILWRIS